MTLFHLVRHGAYGMIDQALGGRAAHPLNAEGLAQAGRVAEALRGRDLAAIVASPVRRAQETAAAIAATLGLATLGLAVSIEPDFAEIEFGAWTGARFDSLHAEPTWQAWNRFRSTARVPQGETMLAVQARGVSGLCRLAASFPQSELVVVSHGDVIKAVLAHFLGAPLDMLRRIEIGPASTSRLALHDDDAKVLGINLPP